MALADKIGQEDLVGEQAARFCKHSKSCEKFAEDEETIGDPGENFPESSEGDMPPDGEIPPEGEGEEDEYEDYDPFAELSKKLDQILQAIQGGGAGAEDPLAGGGAEMPPGSPAGMPAAPPGQKPGSVAMQGWRKIWQFMERVEAQLGTPEQEEELRAICAANPFLSFEAERIAIRRFQADKDRKTYMDTLRQRGLRREHPATSAAKGAPPSSTDPEVSPEDRALTLRANEIYRRNALKFQAEPNNVKLRRWMAIYESPEKFTKTVLARFSTEPKFLEINNL